MENDNQLTIIPVPDSKSAKYNFTCETCSRPFESNRKDKRYCSTKCRVDHFKNKPMAGPENSQSSQSAIPPASVKKMEITGLSPQIQIAVNLLQNEATRWEKAYDREKEKREKLELDLIQLRTESRDKEHQQALQGIEDKKPSGLERFMDAFSKTPAPIIEQLAPIIGALGNLIPKPKTLQGIEGQLDEITLEVVKWMQTKPAEFNQQLYTILGVIAQQPPPQQTESLTKLYNLLTTPTNVTTTRKNAMQSSSSMQIFGT